MPRSSFTSSFLRGAAPGLGRLAQAVGGGRDAYQDAYTKEEQAQSRIAQAVASQHANQAKADQDNAETAIIQGRPQVFDRTVSARAGVSIPQVQAYKQFQDTGFMPERELPGPADESGIGPGSAPVLDEATTTKIGQLIGQLAPALLGNVKDNKPDDLARADQIYGDMGLRDQVLGGQRTAADVGEAQRAVKGGDLFKQSSSGSVLNPLTGDVDQSNPIAEATVALKGAQTTKALRPPTPKGPASQQPIDRDRVMILTQELNNARRAKETATGDALVRAQADESSVVAELKRLGIKDAGQLPKVSKVAAAETAKVGDAKEVLGLLTDAEAQLKDATGSFAGNLYDQGARAVGISTAGAKAAARLKAIEGLLISKMPKMSGPQSDKDVLLYRQMAGQIGDATIPTETRQAAIDTIRQINERYAAGGQQPNGADVVSVTDDDQYNALPSGAKFRTPDGNIRRKP